MTLKSIFYWHSFLTGSDVSDSRPSQLTCQNVGIKTSNLPITKASMNIGIYYYFIPTLPSILEGADESRLRED